MKRLLLALIIILTPILALIPVANSNNTALAWVSGYEHRRELVINGSIDGTLTNYQMMIYVNNSSGISSGSVVYLNGSSLAWPNDIRFTNTSDVSLDYWIESYTSTNATVWVECNSIVTGTSNNLYIYYGKSGDTGASNGSNTFRFFDDFSGSSLDATKWDNINSATVSVSGGLITVQSSSAAWRGILSKSTYALPARFRMNGSVLLKRYNYIGFTSAIGTGDDIIYFSDTASNIYCFTDSGGRTSTAISSGATTHVYDIRWNTSIAKFTYDDANLVTHTDHVPTANLYLGFGAYKYDTTPIITADWVFIANYTTNEPVWYSFGSQENPPCAVYLTTSSDTHGNVTTPGEGTNQYSCNESVSIIATADTCYHFVNWTGNTAAITNTSAASTTIAMGTTNKTATANFAINTSTITYTAGAGGTINGTSPQTGNCGSNTTSVTAVANACYYFVNWSGGSTSATRNDTWTSSNQTFTANFALLPINPPTNIVCVSGSDNIILSWTKGGNASTTYIRYKIGSYPTSITDGNLIGNISGVTYTHTGLSTGYSYYYAFWGLNGSCNGASNSTAICTTYAGGASVGIPSAPDTPANWTGSPDSTAFEDLPTDAIVDQLSAESGIPKTNIYLLLGGLASAILFFVIYGKSGSFLLASMALIIELVTLSAMGLIPMWFVVVFGIVGLGLNWKGLVQY